MNDSDARSVATALSACQDPFEQTPVVVQLMKQWPQYPWLDWVKCLGRPLRHELTIPNRSWMIDRDGDPYRELRARMGLDFERPPSGADGGSDL